ERPQASCLASSADRVALTLALASRVASASAAMDLCSCTGIRTSLISTRATRIPHSSVASSSKVCFQVKRKDNDQKTSDGIYVLMYFIYAGNVLFFPAFTAPGVRRLGEGIGVLITRLLELK
uniref:Uncharacterized protein n=1 Tax=Sus scrofa TaxID=9823 RepID=A0A8D1NGL1_PIG